jgi:nitrate reductase assembly molybdenum cofactor insertion protein NarJ
MTPEFEVLSSPATVRLLREAAEWRLLGLLFQCPQGHWHERLEASANEVEDCDLREAARLAVSQADEGMYHTVFGPGGPAPAREISYRESLQAGGILAEIAGYYEAFAYHPREDEACDHVSVEADFLAYLRLKEAYASARGDSDQASVTAHAAKRFLEDHVAAMAESLARCLALLSIEYLEKAGKALRKRAGRGKEGRKRRGRKRRDAGC